MHAIAHAPTRVNRRIVSLLAIGVGLLAVGAFTLSFDALRSLAELAGIRQELTFLWPLVVDGFIIVATVSAVIMSGRGWRVAWYPWATLLCFGTISVIGNALHAQAHASSTLGIGVAAMVSAVPAVALLLASHLFVLVMPNTARRTSTPEQKKTAGQDVDNSPAVNKKQEIRSVNQRITSKSSQAAQLSTPPADVDEMDVWITKQLTQQRDVTGAIVAKKFSVSPATGR
ncbi:MAG: DUF2637 domain-containing protein, partial [Actinomycetales bacterium]|nr:DUF2637 domain-containing protein [Actinomycetales bacterium]